VLTQAPHPDSLAAGGIRWTTKIVLFPVRFLFTAETGQEGTNHAAVAHYLAQRDPPGPPWCQPRWVGAQSRPTVTTLSRCCAPTWYLSTGTTSMTTSSA
jgi:hypothetical protein